MQSKRAVIVLIIAVVFLWALQRRMSRFDKMEYRGETFKLSKTYTDYDDYKNDPENLDPSEIARVQKLVREPPIQSRYTDLRSLIHDVFEIVFPGYGEGSGSWKQADGTTLLLETIEIPRADADRCLLFREKNHVYELVEDFVSPEQSLPESVTQEGDTIVYHYRGEPEILRRPPKPAKQ